MNRRAFLGLLGAAAVGLAIDPEQLAWKPQQRTFILPPADGWKQIREAQREYNRLRSMEMDRISMRFVHEYDPGKNGFPARFDVLYGYAVVRPELAVRIQG